MSSENYEYKYYQNFIITWDKFYDAGGEKLTNAIMYNVDDAAYSTEIGKLGFTPFENNPSLIGSLNKYGQGKLNLFFDISLNPPKNNPKKIVVKNISSSFTTASGNSFSLICPDLFKFPIQFLDSLNNTVKYEEYKDTQLPTLQAKVNMKRLSGSMPLQTTNWDGNKPVTNIPYVAFPSLNFTIVYEYW